MKNIALIFGGPSGEHDVSLVSAKNIFEVLQKTDFTVFPIGITHGEKWKLIEGKDLLSTSFESPINLEELGDEVILTKQDGSVQILSKENHQKWELSTKLFPFAMALLAKTAACNPF